MTLRDRTSTVLKILVDEYVTSATPVPSEVIARRAPIKASPATIRSEMAELEDQGYIFRPHISAGGTPSDKGYRFYVESIPGEKEPDEDVQRQIRQQFTQAVRDVEVWTQQAAMVLARLADSMAIVTIPRASASRFKYLQLVHLQGFQALLILVFQEARLRQQLLHLQELTTQQQLTETANRLNEAYSGLTYSEFGSKDLSLSPMEETVMGATSTILREVEAEIATDHCVDGLRLLFSKPEFAEGKKAAVLMEVLEDPALLRRLLSKAPDGDSLGVFIGEENAEEALRPFGVVLRHYGIPQQASGVLGVVAPTRMEYPSVMGGVQFLASLLSDLVGGIHSPQ